MTETDGAVDVVSQRYRRFIPLFLLVSSSVVWAAWYLWDTPSRSTSFIAPLVAVLIVLGIWILAQAHVADYTDSNAAQGAEGSITTVLFTALAAALLPFIGFLLSSLVMAALVLALGGTLKQAVTMLALALALVFGLFHQLLLVDLPLLPAL